MPEKCRICLKATSSLDCIDILNKLNEETTVLDGIITISSIQVLEQDILPQFICNQCYIKLDQFYIFRYLIISSDQELKKKLDQNSEDNEETYFQDDSKFFENSSEETEKCCLEGIELLENEDADKIEISKKSNAECDKDTSDSISYRYKQNVINIPDKNRPRNRSKKIISKRDKSNNTKLKRKHECVDCGKAFQKADHLKVHVAYKHSEKKLKCVTCDKKFARKYDLAYHNRVHTGEKPFTCELCGKSFASSSYCYMHKRLHTGVKKVRCEFCQSSFINSDQLRIHTRQKHTGERPFLCELCSQCFSSSSALFRHKRDIHYEKVECPICSKSYSSRVLKDHIKRHNDREAGIKKFNCELCDKRFTCSTSRKRHLVIHTGEKAFKCEVCEKAFNQRSTLQTHMRIHSQIMPFQCDICSKSFRYKHHLKLHCKKHQLKSGDRIDNNQQVYEVKTE